MAQVRLNAPIPSQRGDVVTIDGVNLEECPVPDKDHPPHPNNQVTIGDLHGNALKLIHFLVRQHILVLKPNQYAELVRIYNLAPNEIEESDLQSFENILTVDAFHADRGLVRLIGDEFCDRGSNDYFTLKILERLGQKKLRLKSYFQTMAIHFYMTQQKQNQYT